MKKSFTKKMGFNKQQGVALLSALILLVMLTMLGLASINTSTMEERMASNTQLINRIFQAASSGVEIVYSDSDAFNTNLTKETDGSATDQYKNKFDSSIGGNSGNKYDAITTYNSVYVQSTKGPRSSTEIWDSTFFHHYFDLSAIGCVVVDDTDTDCSTSAIATITLHQGAYQVGNAD